MCHQNCQFKVNLTSTLMSSLSNCSTSVGEHVCTILAHSLLSCSSGSVCIMELTAGHHFFSKAANVLFSLYCFSDSDILRQLVLAEMCLTKCL